MHHVNLKLKVWKKGKMEVIHPITLNSKNQNTTGGKIVRQWDNDFEPLGNITGIGNIDSKYCFLNSWIVELLPLEKKCDVIFDAYIEINGGEERKYMMPQKVNILSDTEPTLEEALKKMHLETPSDVTIICDEEKFPCHKTILSARSDVFKVMFSMPDSKEQQHGVVKIDDVSAKTMKTFLKFMYTDDLEEEEIDCNLLIAADKYDFKRLFNICLKPIEQDMCCANVMEITVAAYLVEHRCKNLLKKASDFIFEYGRVGLIEKCPYWDQIYSKYPAIAAKVMNLVLFGEE